MDKKNENQFPDDYDLNNLLEINFTDFSMFVTQRYKYHYVENKYEEFSSDIYLNLIKEDSVVIDVGANYGYYALLASTKNIKGKTYAIEPVKENFEVLNKSIHQNGFSQLIALNYAISNCSERKEFNVTEASDSAGFYEHPNTKTYEKRIIETRSLDDLFANTKVDVIKIDTEGHEIHVLDGMKKIINSNDNLQILIEFNPKCLEQSGAKPEDLLNKVWSFGFDIFLIKEGQRSIFKLREDKDAWKEVYGNLEYSNLLCVKKKKSLFISFISHSSYKGGAERALIEVLDGLLEKGVICNVVFPSEGPLVEELKKRPIGVLISPFTWWAENENTKVFRDEDMFTQQFSTLIELLNKVNPDIIYSNTSVIDIGAIAARNLGIPHVWHIHEFGEIDHHLNFLLEKTARARYINENSDLVLFNSSAVQQYYQPEILIEKSMVIFNSVKVNLSNAENNKKFFKNNNLKLLILGSVNRGKGQKDAISAVNNLVKKGVPVELLIIGSITSNDYYLELVNYINENSLGEYVHFYDYMDNPLFVLQQSDILLVCSKNEAFGRVTAEAMLLKKPIIASKSGGTLEIVFDHNNGLLYNSGNSQELADKIEELYKNKNLLSIYGNNGFDLASKWFNFDASFGKVIPALYSLKNDKKMYPLYSFAIKIIEKQRQMIEDLYQKIKQKNQDTEEKILEIQNRDQSIIQKIQEIQWMKSSKFWKLKTFYEKFKNPVFHTIRLIKKALFILKRDGLFLFIKKILNKRFVLTNVLNTLITIFPSKYKRKLYKIYEQEFYNNCYYYEEQQNFSKKIKHTSIKVLSYYLPQFHSIPENDKWYGKGFTEWDKVKIADPLFAGHYQPHIPHQDIGYYILNSPEVLKKQVEMMKKSGVYGQIFYHYWFTGKLVLENPAQILLTNKNINMPFCFCWANENWTKKWDGNEKRILLEQNYSKQDAINFIKYLIPFFKDKRYIKINKRPILFIYRPASFSDFGLYKNIWANECKKNGLAEPYIVATLTRGATSPLDYGMDAGVERVLHDWTNKNIVEMKNFLTQYKPMSGSVLNYNDIAEYYMNQKNKKSFTYFRSIVPAWDNTSRYNTEALLLYGSTPFKFQEWIESIIQYTESSLSNDKQFIIINAWNEWAEGAHLEPDKKFGYGYLNSVGRALSDIPFNLDKKDFPVVTTIIRFHKNADFKLLNNALFSLVSQVDCVVQPFLAVQDLLDEQMIILKNLVNKYSWNRRFRPIIETFYTDDENKDLRSEMLNSSLKMVKTKYVAFLDYDDVLFPFAYKYLIDRLKITNKAVSFGNVFTTIVNKEEMKVLERKIEYINGGDYKTFFTNNTAPLHSFMLDLEKINLNNIKYFKDMIFMEDYYLTLQIFTEENTDWESLKFKYFIGDYMHYIDLKQTLAFVNNEDRQEILKNELYILCEKRINDLRNKLKSNYI